MSDREIKIILKADGTAAIGGIKDVENAVGSADSSFKKLVGTLASVTAGYLTLDKASRLVADSTSLAARVETMGVVVDVVGRNAGHSAGEMRGYTEAVQKMGITTSASQDAVTRMTQANMDLTNASRLARIAQDAAVIGNVNSSEALERMVFGIQSAQTEVLRTIGINVSFEQSYARMAEKLGKSTSALTEQEKAHARMNSVLETGRNISGAYSAAMDTVGKQALSLARHSEEAQVKIGELFKPTYAAIVRTATDALTNLNEKLAEMQTTGDLEKWGNRIADVMSVIARDSSALAVGGIAMLTMSIAKMVAGLKLADLTMKTTAVGIVATIAAVGGLELGRYLDSLKPDNKRYQALLKDQAEEKEFLAARWKKIQDQLAADGIKGNWTPRSLADAKDAGDIEEYTVDVGGGKIETHFKDVRAAMAATKSQIDATTKAFSAMGKVISGMGGMKLKFADEEFRQVLKDMPDDLRKITVEYQELSDTMKTGMDLDRQISQVDDVTSAFGKYGSTIEEVYKTQLDMQRDVLQEMQNYETDQKKIIAQAANVTQTEIQYNTEKLASYKSYYDALKSMQKNYYDTAVKAASDRARIEKDMISTSRETADLQYEAWNNAFPAQSELEQYYRDTSRLEQQTAAAMTLSGEERVQALKKIQSAYASLSKQISVTETISQLDFDDRVITTTVNTFEEVSNKIAALGSEISYTQEQMYVDAANNRDKASAAYQALVEPIKAVKSAITNTQSEIVRLDDLLSMQRIVSIDTSGALSGVTQLISYYEYLYSLVSGIGTVSVASSMAVSGYSLETNSGYSLETSSAYSSTYETPAYEGVFASGIDRVPRDMVAKIHKDETVLNPQEAAQYRAGKSGITIGGISVTINGANKDAKQLAREIAPAIKTELKRLEYMS